LLGNPGTFTFKKFRNCVYRIIDNGKYGQRSFLRLGMDMKKGREFFTLVLILLTSATLLNCHPFWEKEAQRPEEALKQVRFFFPKFSDDMDRESLIQGVRRNIEYLDRLAPETVFHYGPHNFSCAQVRETQEAFLNLLSRELDPEQLNREIRKEFRVYRATGREGKGRVLFTGYYEPTYEGKLDRDEVFRYPLYRLPGDLIRIDLSPFNEKFKGESIVARIDGKKVQPYFSRSQIEGGKALDGKDLEIAWLKDPLDVFFLHIQGSGRVRLPDGKDLFVHYQASNGRPYRSIGRYMIERGFLTREEMSMQAMRNYLTERPEVRDEVLNQNPSYIFFQQVETGPWGSLGVLLTPGRSVALDPKFFPKGALAFISSRKPLVSTGGEITEWVKFSRFVLNQDSGGAIKGAGRADIFWGSGPYAELAAGHLQHEGDLYVLIKK
jgi:membrane-bound lytic murein transglycosylase A